MYSVLGMAGAEPSTTSQHHPPPQTPEGNMDLSWLTMTILAYNASTEEVEISLISAFCSSCGCRRGEPELVRIIRDGHDVEVHQWVNPCGHQDTEHEIMFEIELQCQHPWCVLMISDNHFPFCGPECQHMSEQPAEGQYARRPRLE